MRLSRDDLLENVIFYNKLVHLRQVSDEKVVQVLGEYDALDHRHRRVMLGYEDGDVVDIRVAMRQVRTQLERLYDQCFPVEA